MSDNDKLEISKTHSEAALRDRERFELTRKGMADDVGIIATNAAPAESISKTNQKDKDRDEFLTLVQLLDEWQATMADLQAQINDVLDKAQESINRITQMQDLQKDWDFEQAQTFFSDTYNQDISRMAEDAAKQHLVNSMDRETLDYARYMIEARSIEQQMNAQFNDPAFLAATPEQQTDFRDRFMSEGLRRMTELNSVAEDIGVNVEKATGLLTEHHSFNSELFELTDSQIREENYRDHSKDIDALGHNPFETLTPDLSGNFNDAVQSGQTDGPAFKKEKVKEAIIQIKPGSF